MRPTHTTATARDDVNAAAARIFGWRELRPEQISAITAVLAGRDVLAVLRTGSGKSAIYQVPAAMSNGLAIVVSPLIALQRDQISSLDDSAAPTAVALHSRQRRSELAAAWQAIEGSTAAFVFLTPEQLTNRDVVQRLARRSISLIAVDEAHCISAWGHDFRPDYLRLPDAIDALGRPPVVALTATASPPLRDDIARRLDLTDPLIVAGSFDRPNIELDVRHHTERAGRRADVIAAVLTLDGPGLLYCATRRETDEYARELADRGVDVVAYHAGLSAAERDAAHRRFHDGDVSVVVATSAFGMGIDKPDVRFVVHAAAPDSIDSYSQQIGRAGRDDAPSTAILFYRPEDLRLGRFFASKHVDEDLVRRVYSVLREHGPARLRDLRTELGLDARGALTRTVNLLERSGVATRGRDGWSAARHGVETAVARAVEAAEIIERIDRTRVDMLRAYAETTRCRRQHLLAYFGEHLEGPCGNCDRCRAEPHAVQRPPSAIPVDSRVEHREWGPGVVIDGDDERVTVLFGDYGYRTLSVDAVRHNGVLRMADGEPPRAFDALAAG